MQIVQWLSGGIGCVYDSQTLMTHTNSAVFIRPQTFPIWPTMLQGIHHGLNLIGLHQ